MCKLHNSLASALVKYEALWLNGWKTSVQNGRGSLKATLLVQENSLEETVVKVNFKQE